MKYAISMNYLRRGYCSPWSAMLFASLVLGLTPLSLKAAEDGISHTPSGNSPIANDARLQARKEYRLALKDLAKDRISAFKKRKATLANYVLAPYLDYHYQRKRVDRLSSADVAEFMQTYSDYPFAQRLRDRWLLRLPGQGRWNEYLANYVPSSSATRRCYYLRALYRSGKRKAALDQVAPLWLHHKSQPKACDSLFDAWIGAGYLSDDLVWQRMVLALEKNEVTLAKYLIKLARSASFKKQAKMLYDAHVRPQTRFNPAAHSKDTEPNRAILNAGLQRLARKDPAQALAIWDRVKTSHSFSETTRKSIEARLYIEAAEESLYPSERPGDLSDTSLRRIAREAVRQQNWSEAFYWINQMGESTRTQSEWRYWQQRSEGADLRQIAGERNYYGFLAARDVGIDTSLNHQATVIAPAAELKVSQSPGINRAFELYAVDDLINARREWRQVFNELTPQQQAAAARLAQQHGWLDQAIVAANAAQLHNDLDLRFPEVFATIYGKAGHATNLPTSMLLAVTRQESAFAPRARSSANARGLMQLLPETAKRTAKKAGLRTPTTLDLYEPAINIRIASEYLASLMVRYNQQRPLAFAAYNAGEHRVDRWIKDRQGMPMEVWIETIPFRETRGYVKSVLAFNHLYSKRLNKPLPLLLPHEQTLN